MATVDIREGQAATVNPEDTLKYPGINSCLTLTTVLPDGTRAGGHAVMFPVQGQLNLGEICETILNLPGQQLYIMGDLDTWNDSWQYLPQCQQLNINQQQIDDVQGIATALGYQNAVLFNTTPNWGTGTFDIYFGYDNGARRLWAYKKLHITNHLNW